MRATSEAMPPAIRSSRLLRSSVNPGHTHERLYSLLSARVGAAAGRAYTAAARVMRALEACKGHAHFRATFSMDHEPELHEVCVCVCV